MVKLVLLLAMAPLFAAPPVRVLLVTGGHEHEPSIYALFDKDPELQTAVDPHPKAFSGDLRKRFDVIVLYDMIVEGLEAKKRENLKQFVEAGKGIVVLHHAIGDYVDWPWWYDEVTGVKYDAKTLKWKHDETMNVKVVRKHPVTAGLDSFTIHDETYKGSTISAKTVALLETDHSGSDKAVAWLGVSDKARVVTIQLGHDHAAHENPSYRRLVRNAVLWAGGRD